MTRKRTAKKAAKKEAQNNNSFNLSSVLADPKLATEGREFVMVNEHGFKTGAFLKIARINNRNFRRKLRKLMWSWMIATGKDPTKAGSAKDFLSDEESERLEAEAMGGTVLVGWRNLAAEDENGEIQLIPYTEKNAEEILKKHWWLAEQVSRHAVKVDDFRGKAVHELEKNS